MAVGARTEPAVDIRMVVAVVVGNSPAVVAEVQLDHHTVDSDNLAEGQGCKAGWDTVQEAVHHTGDIVVHSLVEDQGADTVAAVVVGHKYVVTAGHCRGTQAAVDLEDPAAVPQASLMVCMVPIDLLVVALHMKMLPVVHLAEDWLRLVMQNPDCLVHSLVEDCLVYLACLGEASRCIKR